MLAAWAGPAIAAESLKIAVEAPEQIVSAPAASDVERQIRAQDRQIFLELVKLAQFNVRFQQTVNHCARWRNLVYPLGQEAAYACLLGFSITDIHQRSKGWKDPSLISPTTTKKALSSAMVGSLLGASSSMLELAANGVETVRANRKGFSVRKSRAFVQSTVKRVDSMLAKRHSLMEKGNFTGTRAELLELKERLLMYERDRLVFEFKRWSAHSRGYAWYKSTFYIINATVNMSRFSAVVLGFKSFTEPKCAGATGPILTTASCLAAMGPAASSTVGNCIQRYQERSLARDLPAATFLSDEEAKQKFERLAQLLTESDTNSQHGQLAAELIHLREERLGLDTLILHQEKNIERLRRVAGQQAFTAPMISSLGAASGILNTIGYHAYRQKPLIQNRLGITGDATVIPAEGIALIATPAAAIKTYLYEHDLKSKNEHPDQLLSARLRDLETLEKMVTESW